MAKKKRIRITRPSDSSEIEDVPREKPDVDALIAKFDRAKPDADGECGQKCGVISDLEDHLSDPTVLAFFLRVAGDPEEHDLARVDVFKAFEFFEPPTKKASKRIGDTFRKVIANEDDDLLVQQWAAQSASEYIDVPGVFQTFVKAMLDTSTEENVRHNLLSSVESYGNHEKLKTVLEKLLDDEELASSAKRRLKYMK